MVEAWSISDAESCCYKDKVNIESQVFLVKLVSTKPTLVPLNQTRAKPSQSASIFFFFFLFCPLWYTLWYLYCLKSFKSGVCWPVHNIEGTLFSTRENNNKTFFCFFLILWGLRPRLDTHDGNIDLWYLCPLPSRANKTQTQLNKVAKGLVIWSASKWQDCLGSVAWRLSAWEPNPQWQTCKQLRTIIDFSYSTKLIFVRADVYMYRLVWGLMGAGQFLKTKIFLSATIWNTDQPLAYLSYCSPKSGR